MRDRTLPMKWVEAIVSAGGNASTITDEFTKRGVKQSTISDQLRRCRKHGLLPAETKDDQSEELIAPKRRIPRPVPKPGIHTKKHVKKSK